jgi:hypothetical protein
MIATRMNKLALRRLVRVNITVFFIGCQIKYVAKIVTPGRIVNSKFT